MENLSVGTTAVIAGITLLILLFSRTARIIALVLALLFVVLAAGPRVLRSKSCSVGLHCLLQPTYAGPCYPQEGATVLREEGNYFMALELSAGGAATCVDWRVWK